VQKLLIQTFELLSERLSTFSEVLQVQGYFFEEENFSSNFHDGMAFEDMVLNHFEPYRIAIQRLNK
jgi:hypothetical protein